MSRKALEPIQLPIQWAPRLVSPVIKELVHEAAHSPPSSVEVKNDGAVPPLLHTSSRHNA
jgi:hypothetical protein